MDLRLKLNIALSECVGSTFQKVGCGQPRFCYVFIVLQKMKICQGLG